MSGMNWDRVHTRNQQMSVSVVNPGEQKKEEGAVARPRSLDEGVNSEGVNRTETDGGVETVSVSVDPAPVSLQGSPANRDNAEESDVPIESSHEEEEGLIMVKDELQNSDTHMSQKQKQNVRSKRTRAWYELGVEDAEYVADVLQISVKDARGILHDCPGANGLQMLSVVLNKENKNRVMGANNRPAYVRVIVRANLTRILAQDPFPRGRKANKTATATSQPLPHSAAPLPMEKQAAPKVLAIETNDDNRAHRDHILAKAFREMGPGEQGTDKYTLMDFARHFKLNAGVGRGCDALRMVCAHLHDMRLRGLVLSWSDTYCAVPGALEALRPPAKVVPIRRVATAAANSIPAIEPATADAPRRRLGR